MFRPLPSFLLFSVPECSFPRHLSFTSIAFAQPLAQWDFPWPPYLKLLPSSNHTHTSNHLLAFYFPSLFYTNYLLIYYTTHSLSSPSTHINVSCMRAGILKNSPVSFVHRTMSSTCCSWMNGWIQAPLNDFLDLLGRVLPRFLRFPSPNLFQLIIFNVTEKIYQLAFSESFQNV